MSVFKFRPARDAAEAPELVADLDTLSQKPIGVALFGKVRTIKKVTVLAFGQFYDELDKATRKSKSKDTTTQDVIEAYYDMFKIVSDDFPIEDIRKMNHTQTAQLIAIICEHLQGKSNVTAEKKKTMVPAQTQS